MKWMGEDEELRSKQKFYWSWKILLKEVSFEAGLQSFKCRHNSNRRDTEFQVVEPNLFGVWNREDGFTSWSKKITCSDKYIGMRLGSWRMRGVTWSTFCLQKTIWVTWFWTLWSFFSRCLGKSTSRELSSSQDHKSRWKLTVVGGGNWQEGVGVTDPAKLKCDGFADCSDMRFMIQWLTTQVLVV